MDGGIGLRENAQAVGRSAGVHRILHKQFGLVDNSAPGKATGPEGAEGSPGQTLSSATFGGHGPGSFT